MPDQPLARARKRIVDAPGRQEELERLTRVPVASKVGPGRVEPGESRQRFELQRLGEAKEHEIDAERAPAERLRLVGAESGDVDPFGATKKLIRTHALRRLKANRAHAVGDESRPRVARAGWRKSRQDVEHGVELCEKGELVCRRDARRDERLHRIGLESAKRLYPLLIPHLLGVTGTREERMHPLDHVRAFDWRLVVEDVAGAVLLA